MQKLRQLEQQKEVQTINHTLRSYQFLLLVTCFGFYNSHRQAFQSIRKYTLFTHQQMHFLLNLENLNLHENTHNYRSYMFRFSTILRELVQGLAKVILLLKHSVKLRRCILCGDVAACREMECVLFVVQSSQQTAHTPHSHQVCLDNHHNNISICLVLYR